MVLKKVLGFATTTSLILLVMVAPTTATTATASLQQQEDNETSSAAVNATTTDEPNIPIGPADEGPDEPIPNNENETRNDDDDHDIMCALGEGSDEDNPCGDCGGRGACATIPIENDTDDNPDTWINWVKTTIDGHRVRDGGVVYSHKFIVDFQSTATDTGKGSYVQFNIDKGPWKHVASPYKFSISSCGEHTIYLQGVDKYGNKDPTPAKFTIIIKDCKKPAPGNGNPETWINSVRTPAGKNIPNGGSTSSKVVTVDFQSTATDTGKGSHIDLKIDNGRYKAVASPKTIKELGVGKHTISLRGVDRYGNEDPTPPKWTFTVTGGGAGGPDTWINWVRATPKGVNIANGGSTSSSTVIVDFQGTVAGKGSHIDLKIDSGSYVPVASPRTITGLSDGPHTIYLKAVNQAGKADPTPARWRFTVINDNDNDD